MKASPTHHLVILLLAAGLLPLVSCAGLFTDPENSSEQSFESDPEDYFRRAKEYFGNGEYARARNQLNNYLKKKPNAWMARLQMNYCDYYEGIERLKAGDLEGGRKLFRRGEAGLRKLWNGRLAKSTTETRLAPVQPWKAAMGIAMMLRGLGWADQLEIERKRRQLQSLPRLDETRERLVAEMREIEERRQKNYAAAASLFERLAAMENAPPDAIKNLAELRLIQGRDEEAEAAFRRYLTIAQKSYETNKELEKQFPEAFRIEKDRAIAEHFLKEKLESNVRKRVDVLVHLGLLAFQKKEYEKAVGYLEEAHSIRPDRLDILLKMGRCYGENRQYVEALKVLDEYIEKRSEKQHRFDDEIAEAYRLKTRYSRKQPKERKR